MALEWDLRSSVILHEVLTTTGPEQRVGNALKELLKLNYVGNYVLVFNLRDR